LLGWELFRAPLYNGSVSHTTSEHKCIFAVRNPADKCVGFWCTELRFHFLLCDFLITMSAVALGSIKYPSTYNENKNLDHQVHWIYACLLHLNYAVFNSSMNEAWFTFMETSHYYPNLAEHTQLTILLETGVCNSM